MVRGFYIIVNQNAENLLVITILVKSLVIYNPTKMIYLVLTNVHVKSVRDLKEVFYLNRYNNFDKLIRDTCFVFRFIFNCKKKINKEKQVCIGCSKNEEIENSQVLWLINE